MAQKPRRPRAAPSDPPAHRATVPAAGSLPGLPVIPEGPADPPGDTGSDETLERPERAHGTRPPPRGPPGTIPGGSGPTHLRISPSTRAPRDRRRIPRAIGFPGSFRAERAPLEPRRRERASEVPAGGAGASAGRSDRCPSAPGGPPPSSMPEGGRPGALGRRRIARAVRPAIRVPPQVGPSTHASGAGFVGDRRRPRRTATTAPIATAATTAAIRAYPSIGLSGSPRKFEPTGVGPRAR